MKEREKIKYYEEKYDVTPKWQYNNCINCSHFSELNLSPDNYFNPNFTHYASTKCPYMPDDMVSYGPGGEVCDTVLIDFRDGTAWIDGGMSTVNCSGWEMPEPDWDLDIDDITVKKTIEDEN
jgi:hypothetical protein